MAYLAAIEVDQRQRIVTSADKLKEMLGGSWTIEDTESLALMILTGHPDVRWIKIASGDVWLRAEDMNDLATCLRDFRQRIVDKLGLPCSFAVVAEEGNPDESRKSLMNKMFRVKSGKPGEVGHLSLPWLAPCQIQPDLYANLWYPDREKNEQYRRRALVSSESNARFDRGHDTLAHYYERFRSVRENNLRYPQHMDHFAPSGDSSYLALLRFDADNAGTLFEDLPLGDNLSESSWDSLRICSKAFGECLREALEQAFDETIKEAINDGGLEKGRSFIPISPLIAAGDDLLIVIRKDIAMRFALRLLRVHKEIAAADTTLKLYLAGRPAEKGLTLSGAVMFARSGFPFSVLSEMSVNVEKSAKKLRHEDGQAGPCLDVYWLESTGREEPIRTREASLTYRQDAVPNDLIFSLNTRPWTLPQAEAMQNAAEILAKHDIPKGKWHQLLDGLKDGDPLASFHFRRWLQHLTLEQQECIRSVTDLLEPVRLWDTESEPWVATLLNGAERKITPLFELHQLREMLDAGANSSEELQSV